MMGAHHAACGAAAWVALTTKLQISTAPLHHAMAFLPGHLTLGFGLLHVSPVGVVAGALVTAGAALVPDADHHNATIAHSLPPLSNAMCAQVGRLAGGHRHGTHSVLGLAVFVFIAWLAGLWTIQLPRFGTIYPGAGLLSVILVAFAAKALKLIPDTMRRFPWVAGLVFGAFIMFFAPQEQGWFPVAVAAGVMVHIAGDMLTTGGCNLVWPLAFKRPKALAHIPVVSWMWKPSGYFAIPVLGNAGSWREWLLLVPVGLYAVIGVAVNLVGVGQGGIRHVSAALGVG